MKPTLFSFYLELCRRQRVSLGACVSWDVNGLVIDTVLTPEMHVLRGATGAPWAALPQIVWGLQLSELLLTLCNSTRAQGANPVCVSLALSSRNPEWLEATWEGRLSVGEKQSRWNPGGDWSLLLTSQAQTHILTDKSHGHAYLCTPSWNCQHSQDVFFFLVWTWSMVISRVYSTWHSWLPTRWVPHLKTQEKQREKC